MQNSTGIAPAAVQQRPSARALALRMVRAAGIGSLAGALSGIVWGVLARLAMRLLARAMRRLPSFSLEGTALIILVGILMGSISGVVYAGLRAMLPWRRIWKGLACGVALLLTFGMLLFNGPLVDEGNPEVAGPAMILFGALFLIWGALIEALYEPINRRLLTDNQGLPARIASAIAMAVPLLLGGAVLIAQQLGAFDE